MVERTSGVYMWCSGRGLHTHCSTRDGLMYVLALHRRKQMQAGGDLQNLLTCSDRITNVSDLAALGLPAAENDESFIYSVV